MLPSTCIPHAFPDPSCPVQIQIQCRLRRGLQPASPTRSSHDFIACRTSPVTTSNTIAGASIYAVPIRPLTHRRRLSLSFRSLLTFVQCLQPQATQGTKTTCQTRSRAPLYLRSTLRGPAQRRRMCLVMHPTTCRSCHKAIACRSTKMLQQSPLSDQKRPCYSTALLQQRCFHLDASSPSSACRSRVHQEVTVGSLEVGHQLG
jgi:hypothetical protein